MSNILSIIRNNRPEITPEDASTIQCFLDLHRITKVSVHFSGYGDEGNIDRMDVASNDTDLELNLTVEFKGLTVGNETLEDIFDTVTKKALELAGGWDDNEGSYGTVNFRNNGTVDIEINWAEITYSPETIDITASIPEPQAAN